MRNKVSDLHIVKATLHMGKESTDHFLKQVYDLSMKGYSHMYAFGAMIPVTEGVRLVAEAMTKAVDVSDEDE